MAQLIPAPITNPPVSGHFVVVLRREAGGPELIRRPVEEAWLADLRGEMWRDFYLRRGQRDVRIEDVAFDVVPAFAEGSSDGSRCSGVTVSSQSGEARLHQRTYSIDAFADVAAQTAQTLVAQRVLEAADNYSYEVVWNRTPAGAAAPKDLFRMTSNTAPLRYLRIPLRSLTERAESVGELVAGQFPIFYTRRAGQDGERHARRGAESQPPQESGCALVGPLCSCPDTGEFFLVVTAALEALDAEERSHSLTYTPKTWGRLQAIVGAMQSQEGKQAYRILGQAHGHNFLPAGGAPPCEVCHESAVCARTSVFVSSDDRLWSQAVFSRQPWAICHIFGLNAREEKVQAMYSLEGNRLRERGYYLIDDFTLPSAVKEPLINAE